MTRRSMHRAGPLYVTAVGVASLALGAVMSWAQGAAPSIARGKALFAAKGCYECHGLAAQGSIATGPALAPTRLLLGGFRAYVRTPAGSMPPYSSKILPDTELDEIFAYLRSLPSPKPVAQIPLLAPFAMPRGAAQK
jgi:mono/diheme cytochrome c family protein